MLMSCSLARQKYIAFLENQRELKKTEQQKRNTGGSDDPAKCKEEKVSI